MAGARLVSLAVVLALVAGACRSTPTAPPAPSSPDVWATVDGREITRDTVERAYRRTAPASSEPSEEEALTAKLRVLNDVIVQDILTAKAQALKITVTDAELDKAYADGRKDIPEEAFQQELAKRKLTAEDMRNGLRGDMLAQKVFDHEVGSKIVVTEADVNAFFAANKARFNRPEDAYHIAQIVVTPVKEPQVANRTGNDATTAAEATEKVQMLMERLKGGTSFSELAADFSEDPDTAPRGGDLGFVPVSALQQAPPPLRDAVLQGTPGNVRTVSMGGGHTIVLLIAKEDAGQRDLSTPGVRDTITNALRSRREELLRTAYINALRNDATIVNYLAQRIVQADGKVPTGLAPAAPGAQ